MRGQLLGRVPVRWPSGTDRQKTVDAMVDHWLDQWTTRKANAPWRAWLSDKVLEVHVDNITFWTVLTEQEIALFWEAPMATRLLLTNAKRESMIQIVKDYIEGEMHPPA